MLINAGDDLSAIDAVIERLVMKGFG